MRAVGQQLDQMDTASCPGVESSSLLPFAALANQENCNTALSVSFRLFIQFILH